MILYGTRVTADLPFGLALPETSPFVTTEVTLLRENSSLFPPELTVGFTLYRAHGRIVRFYSDRQVMELHKGTRFRYEVEGLLHFDWHAGERQIHYRTLNPEAEALLPFWFIHLFYPFYLHLEGVHLCIHAGVVELEGQAVILCAPSTGGKSTLTDLFVRKGHRLVTDDKAALFLREGEVFAIPSHPYHRPYRQFETLGQLSGRFDPAPLPVSALYELEISDDNALRIGERRGMEKFGTLLPYSLFGTIGEKPQQMSALGNLARNLRIFGFKRPWDLERLEESYEAILRHQAALHEGE